MRGRSRESRSRAGAAGLGARGLASADLRTSAGAVVTAREAAELYDWDGEGGGPGSGRGRAGSGPVPLPTSAPLLVLLAADEPDDPRPGAGAGVRARVGAALVCGGDPQEQPELVAGGRCGRERRALGTRAEGGPPGVTRGLREGGQESRFLLHSVYPAAPVHGVNNASLPQNATVAVPRHPGRAGP